MLKKVLKQINDYKIKNGKYPKFIYIKERDYKLLKFELSLVEKIDDNIKMVYLINFKTIKGGIKNDKTFL